MIVKNNFLLFLLALSCSPVVTNQGVPAVDVPVVSVPSKPLFSTAIPVKETVPLFSTGVREEPRSEIVRYLVRDRIRIDTVVRVDTVERRERVPEYVYKEVVVHSRGLAYLMLVIGFAIGMIFWFCFMELLPLNKEINRHEAEIDAKINRKRKR